MAEGGDPETTNPFDHNEGADESTPLVPHQDGKEVEIGTMTRTSTSHREEHHSQETSFIN